MPVMIGGFRVGAVRAGGVFNTAPVNINATKNAMKLSAGDASFNVGNKNIRILETIDLSKSGSERGGDMIDTDFLDKNV